VSAGPVSVSIEEESRPLDGGILLAPCSQNQFDRRVKMKRFATLIALFGFLTGIVTAQDNASPNLVFTNGKIITVDGEFSIADTLVVSQDRIRFVGTKADASKMWGENPVITDLRGATVLPGLIDSHVHAVGASMFEYDHEVPTMESIVDVLAYVKTRAELLPEGDWIRLSQVFITRLKERRFPTRQELDSVAPNHPVWFRTGPDAALNSLALKLSGIDKDFQVPEGSNAKVERDPETGEATGIIRTAGGLVKVTPNRSEKASPDFEKRLERLRLLIEDYNKVGLTGIHARNVSGSSQRLYEELRKRGQLTCRVYLYRGISAGAPIEKTREQLSEYAKDPLFQYNNLLWLRGVKMFLDGGMLTGSAYMNEPWGVSKIYGITDPEYRGIRYAEPDKVYEIAKAALENGLQMTAHAVGDGAVDTLVDAYSRIAENDFPIRDKRPCVTHCNFMTAEAIDKMAEHGIVCDLQPAWLWLDGSTLTKQFGRDRLEWFQPYASLFEKGVTVGGGSDHMQKVGSYRSVNPYNPFLGMWIALTRQPRRMEEGDPTLRPEQRISREQAIRLYTIQNATISFEEKEKGSLEKGKLADFIVLDRDILECSVEEIKEITVKETWLGGKKIAGE
jgi:predicted amidohydrolase YtcJ|tara:strand:- start:107 stop:1966 length:1860 start_codon:yes stop_codon:yes gene_type:complete